MPTTWVVHDTVLTICWYTRKPHLPVSSNLYSPGFPDLKYMLLVVCVCVCVCVCNSRQTADSEHGVPESLRS